MKKQVEFYDQLYRENANFRETWEGRISVEYKVPKYVDVLCRRFHSTPPMDVLELGAGTGDLSESIRSRHPDFIKSYFATEISSVGVQRLADRGFKAAQASAEDLSMFDDDSFDLVLCFDVMHHVRQPALMAQEMMRVSRKYAFLIEANGLCGIRKILEMTRKYKSAGEKSYTPWRYLSFFKAAHGKGCYSIRPFLFSAPFTPPPLIKPMIWFSELLERIPVLRWQCSGVIIVGEKSAVCR